MCLMNDCGALGHVQGTIEEPEGVGLRIFQKKVITFNGQLF